VLSTCAGWGGGKKGGEWGGGGILLSLRGDVCHEQAEHGQAMRSKKTKKRPGGDAKDYFGRGGGLRETGEIQKEPPKQRKVKSSIIEHLPGTKESRKSNSLREEKAGRHILRRETRSRDYLINHHLGRGGGIDNSLKKRGGPTVDIRSKRKDG